MERKDWPTRITILGVPHKVEYKENVGDIMERETAWGSFDPWTREIKVWAPKGRDWADVLETLIHEVLHAVKHLLHLEAFAGDVGHDELDLVALALTDMLIRNNWLKE